jgi:esterase/lipase superfamily enzyme
MPGSPSSENPRVAVVAADPFTTTRERLDEEAEFVSKSFQNTRAYVEAIHTQDLRDLAEQLAAAEADIVHLTGHGSVTKRVIMTSANGDVRNISGTTLNTAISTGRPPSCVILNDCSVSRNRDALSVEGRTLIVVSGPPASDVSVEFSTSFYEALSHTRNYERAYLQTMLWLENSSTVNLSRAEFYPDPAASLLPGDAPTLSPAEELLRNRFEDTYRGEDYTPAGSQAAYVDYSSGGARVTSPVPPKIIDVNNGAVLYRVWFATNRAPYNRTDSSAGFGHGYSEESHYGWCRVLIPKHHRIGSLDKFPWVRRLVVRKRGEMQIAEISVLNEDEYFANLASALGDLSHDERILLFYIHGYNVSFEEAALRAAQLGADLKAPGETVFFSWPSYARLAEYAADIAAAEASEGALTQFLCDLIDRTGAERIHVIAHSMGNRVLIRTVQQVLTRVSESTGVPFGQIFLAAPDVDARLFTQLAGAYPQLSQRTTMYVSEHDVPLQISGKLHRYPRAGYKPPITTVKKVDTIEVPKFDFDRLGHGYYAAARPILADMFTLILKDVPPQRRQGISAAADTASGGQYWTMRK